MKALLIVLVVLLLVGFLPLGCTVKVDEGTALQLIIGPFHKKILPKPKEKPLKPKKEKKAKERKPKAEKPKPRFGLSDLQTFLPMIRTALRAVGSLRRSILVHTLLLHVTYGAQDAAGRGINYGRAWAVLGTLTSPLDAALRIRRRDLRVLYDPEATSFGLRAELTATVFVWQILWIALYYGISILKQFLRARKKRKAVQTYESSSD